MKDVLDLNWAEKKIKNEQVTEERKRGQRGRSADNRRERKGGG